MFQRDLVQTTRTDCVAATDTVLEVRVCMDQVPMPPPVPPGPPMPPEPVWFPATDCLSGDGCRSLRCRAVPSTMPDPPLPALPVTYYYSAIDERQVEGIPMPPPPPPKPPFHPPAPHYAIAALVIIDSAID